MSCACPPCGPVQPCDIENYGQAFPSLVGPTGATGGTSIVVENLAALRLVATAQLTSGFIAFVNGHTTANDGGGGIFYYHPANVSADNDGTIVEPSSTVGRWLRQIDLYTSVEMFGAVGDGVADDTAAILAAITFVGANATVIFNDGKTYKTTALITIPADGVTLLGYGATITSATESQFRKFRFSARTRGAVLGLRFECLYSAAATGLSEGTVEVINSNEIRIVDCEFNAIAKQGVYVFGTSAYTLISNNRFYRNFCGVFSDDDGANQPTRMRIVGNKFLTGLGTVSTAFSGAIKISGAGTIASTAGHVISGNTIDTCGQMGIEIQTWVNDCAISGNTINATGYGISVSDSARASVTGNTVKAVVAYSMEASGSTSISFAGNVIFGATTAYGYLVTTTSVDVNICGGAIWGCERSIFLQNSSRITICGVTLGAAVVSFIYNQSCSDVLINGNLLSAAVAGTTVGFIDLDSTNAVIARVIISNNIFKGTITNNCITLNTPANSITDVLVCDNNTAGMVCPGGAFSENGGSSATRLLRFRCYDNVGPGSIQDFSNSFNTQYWSKNDATTFFWRYYALERGIISVDATAGALGFELPPATNMAGYEVTIMKGDAGVNLVTVTSNAGTINGAASYTGLTAQYKLATFFSNGTNWLITQSN